MKTFKLTIFLLGLLLVLVACTENEQKIEGGEAVKQTYVNITAEEAKSIMESDAEYVIVDARTPEEFSEGHIPGAVLIPYDEISEKAESILTDKDKTILIYCRSGRRSKIAAEALLELGYTDIREFGGIIDWKYEIVIP